MNTLTLVLLSSCLVTWCHGSIGSLTFESTFESYVTGGDEIFCMGNCVGGLDKKRCLYDWNRHEKECKPTLIPTKRYRTITNRVCVSNCGYFEGETYQWCAIGDNQWDYCNRKIALKAIASYRTNNKYVTCSDECTTRGESYNWCNTVVDGWQKCNLDKKVLVFNYPTEDIITECSTPCELYKSDDFPHCYDKSGKWKRCYLNPAYEDVLSEINRDFTEHCKENEGNWVQHNSTHGKFKRDAYDLDFTCPVNVEDVATRHEENNPSGTVRTWDPNNPITTDRNPIISYTVFPTYSYFGDDQVNLPLVLRAVLTNHAMHPVGGSRDPFTTGVNNNFNSMDTNMNHLNYDERGHILASRLGGPMEMYNIFPQSWGHNRGSGSTWYYFEQLLDGFLRGHNDRHAIYTAVLSYGTDQYHILQHRPTAVALRVRLYINGQLSNILGHPLNSFADNVYESLYFSNNPDH